MREEKQTRKEERVKDHHDSADGTENPVEEPVEAGYEAAVGAPWFTVQPNTHIEMREKSKRKKNRVKKSFGLPRWQSINNWKLLKQLEQELRGDNNDFLCVKLVQALFTVSPAVRFRMQGGTMSARFEQKVQAPRTGITQHTAVGRWHTARRTHTHA